MLKCDATVFTNLKFSVGHIILYQFYLFGITLATVMSDKVFRGGFRTVTSITDVATPASKVHVNTSFCKRPCDLWWVSKDCFTVKWHKKQDFKGFLQMFSNE